MTDDEGTSISGEEAKESMKQAFVRHVLFIKPRIHCSRVPAVP